MAARTKTGRGWGYGHPVKSRAAWPEELRVRSGVAGVHVDGCVAARPWLRRPRRDTSAHAHVTGEHRGWICFRSEEQLADRHTVLHELAHLIAGPGHSHGKIWRQILVDIGGKEALDRYAAKRRGRTWVKYRAAAAVLPIRSFAAGPQLSLDLAVPDPSRTPLCTGLAVRCRLARLKANAPGDPVSAWVVELAETMARGGPAKKLRV